MSSGLTTLPTTLVTLIMRFRKTILFTLILIIFGLLSIRVFIWAPSSKTESITTKESQLIHNSNHLPSINNSNILQYTNSKDDIVNTSYCSSYDGETENNNMINYTRLENILYNMLPLDKNGKSRYLSEYKSNCWSGYRLNPSISLPQLRIQYMNGELLNEKDSPYKMEKDIVCLPNVFMGGFPKSGSHYVYNVLSIHPLIATSDIKEPHFWTSFPFTNDKYSNKIALLSYLSNYNSGGECPQCLTIDASQSLLWKTLDTRNDCALPKLIKKFIPRAKFILLIRDPIEQTYSDFFTFGLKGCEKYLLSKSPVLPKIFDLKITSEVNRFNRCTNTHSPSYCAHYIQHTSPTVYKDCGRLRLMSSLYYIHIQRWLQYFPKEQFLIMHLDDFIVKPYSSASRVWSFLGLTPLTRDVFNDKIKAIPLVKVTHYKKHMYDNTRQLLHDFFSPYNVKLAKLLNDDKFMYT